IAALACNAPLDLQDGPFMKGRYRPRPAFMADGAGSPHGVFDGLIGLAAHMFTWGPRCRSCPETSWEQQVTRRRLANRPCSPKARPKAGMIGVSFTGTFPADLAGSADNV